MHAEHLNLYTSTARFSFSLIPRRRHLRCLSLSSCSSPLRFTRQWRLWQELFSGLANECWNYLQGAHKIERLYFEWFSRMQTEIKFHFTCLYFVFFRNDPVPHHTMQCMRQNIQSVSKPSWLSGPPEYRYAEESTETANLKVLISSPKTWPHTDNRQLFHKLLRSA